MTRLDPFSDDPIEASYQNPTKPVAGLMALVEAIGLELDIDGECEDLDQLIEETLEGEDDETSNDQEA